MTISIDDAILAFAKQVYPELLIRVQQESTGKYKAVFGATAINVGITNNEMTIIFTNTQNRYWIALQGDPQHGFKRGPYSILPESLTSPIQFGDIIYEVTKHWN